MDQDLDKQLNAIRIIIGAMAAGLITFGAVAIAIGDRLADPALASILPLVLILLAVSEFIAYFVLRMVTLNALREQVSGSVLTEVESKVLGTFSTLTLIRSAMAESVGLFGIIVAMLTGMKIAFAAPALSLLILSLGFPTRQKLNDLTDQLTGRNPFAG